MESHFFIKFSYWKSKYILVVVGVGVVVGDTDGVVVGVGGGVGVAKTHTMSHLNTTSIFSSIYKRQE
jgi:hypothetical protein